MDTDDITRLVRAKLDEAMNIRAHGHRAPAEVDLEAEEVEVVPVDERIPKSLMPVSDAIDAMRMTAGWMLGEVGLLRAAMAGTLHSSAYEYIPRQLTEAFRLLAEAEQQLSAAERDARNVALHGDIPF